MAKRNPSWDHLTKELTSDDGLAEKHRITFHCFNPNGLYAKLQAVQERVSMWCKEHSERPNGVLFVHGSLNDFPRKELFAALDAPRKRKDVSRTIQRAINLTSMAIKDAEEFLADEKRWPAPNK